MDHESQTVQPGNPKDWEAQWRSCEQCRSLNNTHHYKNNLLTRLEEANNWNNNDEHIQTSCCSKANVQKVSKERRLKKTTICLWILKLLNGACPATAVQQRQSCLSSELLSQGSRRQGQRSSVCSAATNRQTIKQLRCCTETKQPLCKTVNYFPREEALWALSNIVQVCVRHRAMVTCTNSNFCVFLLRIHPHEYSKYWRDKRKLSFLIIITHTHKNWH